MIKYIKSKKKKNAEKHNFLVRASDQVTDVTWSLAPFFILIRYHKRGNNHTDKYCL